MSSRKPVPCVLALDLGTSSCKARIVDADGTTRGSASIAYETFRPGPQWAEQNPRDWLHAATQAVHCVLGESRVKGSCIVGIGMTCAAHIAVLLDQNHQPLRPAILWNDQRSEAEVCQLERRAGEMILRTTYQAVSTSWSLPHLAWVRRHDSSAWRHTRKILLSKDYLGYWLTGRFATDPATALSSQLYDPAGNQWSRKLCRLIGADEHMLPDVIPAIARIGELQEHAARQLGLPCGIPVINGTLDSATELLSAGITEPGQGLVRLASAGGIQIITKGPKADRYRIIYPYMLNNNWYCQGGTNCCAGAVQWAMNLVSPAEKMDYDGWDKAASSVPPGSDGLLFHPYLAGERAPYWRSDLRGNFSGLTLGHQLSHIARSVYEGTAFSIRDAMRVLPERYQRPDILAVAGGGAKSAVWLGIVADVLGTDLYTLKDSDSSYGAAMLALTGCGVAPDLNVLAASRRKHGRLIRSNPTRSRLYTQLFKNYRKTALPPCPANARNRSR